MTDEQQTSEPTPPPNPPLTPEQQRRQTWLDDYTKRISPLLTSLALVYLVTYSIQAIWYDPKEPWFQVLMIFGNILWLLFAVDLIFRFIISPVKRHFFKRNWLDTITVVLPQFRVLRVLHAFAPGGLISKKTGLINRGSLVGGALGALIFIWVGSLMVLNAERAAPKAEIVNVGDAVWWAFETITTVGYGDFVPVTWIGRGLAVIVMLVGITLFGGITATLSAVLVRRAHQHQQQQQQDPATEILQELAELKAMVASLQASQGKSP
jgi:voltage-gated potassium channel